MRRLVLLSLLIAFALGGETQACFIQPEISNNLANA